MTKNRKHWQRNKGKIEIAYRSLDRTYQIAKFVFYAIWIVTVIAIFATFFGWVK